MQIIIVSMQLIGPNGNAGKRIFSKIDLLRAFHQILIAKSDIPKTTVITPFDLYWFLLMMFGLRNAA